MLWKLNDLIEVENCFQIKLPEPKLDFSNTAGIIIKDVVRHGIIKLNYDYEKDKPNLCIREDK